MRRKIVCMAPFNIASPQAPGADTQADQSDDGLIMVCIFSRDME